MRLLPVFPIARLVPALALVASATVGVGCAANVQDESVIGQDEPFEGEAVDTMRQVLILAHEAGVSCANLPMAGAIAKAESGLDTRNRSRNPPTSGCPRGSLDRGLWQINDCYHREVSDSCSYDGACNARAMSSISSRGTNWHPWSTYWNGAYKRYLGQAQSVYRMGIPGCNAPGGGGGGGGGGGHHGRGCHSDTLRRNVSEHTCVRSRFDGHWYSCLSGHWHWGKGVGGACSSVHPL